jgi:hypothetical protein
VAITKTTTTSIKDASVEEANINNCAATNTKLGADAVTSAKINNGAVTTDDLASTLDLSSKSMTLGCGAVTADSLASTLDLSSKTLTLPDTAFEKQYANIGLLGFKMAVNESLTVFNLVDGVVDEFNDESGTDEAEGSNDNYCGTDDFYNNTLSGCISAGFALTSVTEPDTSTAGTNPAQSTTTFGSFTVPCGMTSVNIQTWGAGGGRGQTLTAPQAGGQSGTAMGRGGGGGYAEGTLAVSGSQVLYVGVGEGGGSPTTAGEGGGGGAAEGGHQEPVSNGTFTYTLSSGGGGGSGVVGYASYPQKSQPSVFVLAAGGGGAGGGKAQFNLGDVIACAGAGGGLTGCAGWASGFPGNEGSLSPGPAGEQTGYNGRLSGPGAPGHQGTGGGGGDQEQGGQGGGGSGATANSGTALKGGNAGEASGAFCSPWTPLPQAYGRGSGGGGGYYGGGGGGVDYPGFAHGGAGGGSSYHGHPQVTSGSTEEGNQNAGGGTSDPAYVPGTNEGANYTASTGQPALAGEDGYVLLTGSFCTAQNTTIVSTAFTSTSVATSSRIVVFEENIDTPTLNTDIIASVSRDGGTTFTNATLSDSGYVTGSSGQRILTGQADISGQPSGQSMRWKLQLANNQVKIHGVSLSWA